MSNRFNADEVFEIAITIERNSQAFYSKAAEKFDENVDLNKLLNDLVAWEKSHEKLFSIMKTEFAERYPDSIAMDPDCESARYLQAIADGKIFRVATEEEEISMVGDNILELLDYAINKEKEAVLFFLALKEMIPDEEGKEKIQEVINEEMGHAVYLAEKKAALAVK